jgi:hypothetical protein
MSWLLKVLAVVESLFPNPPKPPVVLYEPTGLLTPSPNILLPLKVADEPLKAIKVLLNTTFVFAALELTLIDKSVKVEGMEEKVTVACPPAGTV